VRQSTWANDTKKTRLAARTMAEEPADTTAAPSTNTLEVARRALCTLA
jgi:hypothetical protein